MLNKKLYNFPQKTSAYDHAANYVIAKLGLGFPELKDYRHDPMKRMAFCNIYENLQNKKPTQIKKLTLKAIFFRLRYGPPYAFQYLQENI